MGIGGLGMAEMVLIFLVVLLLFGAKRLPEIGSALGKGIREFKGSVREIENELRTPPEAQGPKKPTADQKEEGEPRRLTEGTVSSPTPTPSEPAREGLKPDQTTVPSEEKGAS